MFVPAALGERGAHRLYSTVTSPDVIVLPFAVNVINIIELGAPGTRSN
jgi:hypothetical protein